ncbi:MAG TPA: type II toxin-antitoxin system VapC family toxin [Caulobacteraceae bacterium]|jgi:PIN domain nuclease of toxin-antitoxin system
MTDVVLDTSAVLADLLNEPGAERVRGVTGARLSAVNFAEVVAKLIDKGFAPEDARGTAFRLSADVVPMDQDDAAEAGVLRQSTRRFGLSLGDRACLALASRMRASVLTADRAWAQLDLGVDIQLIR